MPTNHLDHAIRSRIDSLLGELSLLVKRQALEAVHGVLGEATGGRRGPGRPRGSGRRSPGRPRKAGRPRRAAKGKRVRRST